MNGHCSTCDMESRCGYQHKPCDCCNYRKFTPITFASSTSSTGIGQIPALDDIVKQVEMIEKAGNSDKWTVISPKGIVYQGDFSAVFSVMVSEYPLFNLPGIVRVDA